MVGTKKRVHKKWAGRKRRERVLQALLEGETDLESLAGRLEMRLGELATVCGEEETAAALAGLRRLADVQTQLVVSRYRVTAAAKLVALANQEEDAELARKACGDLLKVDLVKGEVRRAGEQEKRGTGEGECEVDVVGVLEALKGI